MTYRARMDVLYWDMRSQDMRIVAQKIAWPPAAEDGNDDPVQVGVYRPGQYDTVHLGLSGSFDRDWISGQLSVCFR